MTPQTEHEQLKALAELDGPEMWGVMKRGLWYRPNAKGYTSNPEEAWHLTKEEAEEQNYPHDEPVTAKLLPLKNYRHSYDAIIPLAVKVCKRRKLRMFCNMGLDGTWECVITANETPNCIPCDGDFYGAGDTLADAVKESLLRATGKWKD